MEFVNFKIAKKLKEKGFYYKCVSTYDKDGMLGDNYIQPTSIRAIGFDELLSSHNVENDGCIDAPTISQVLKWLREEKNIILSIYPSYFKEDCCFGLDCDIWKNGNYEHRCVSDNSYEEAALAGIEYVLDKII